MMPRSYMVGLDVLGFFGAPTGTASGPTAPEPDVGPLSPEQLSKLDRALTPAEQKVVDDWQASQADAALAAERAKGGPTSSTVAVTAKGATIKSNAPRAGARVTASKSVGPVVGPTAQGDGFFNRNVPWINAPFWKVMLGIVGFGAGAGLITYAVHELRPAPTYRPGVAR